MMNTEVVLDSMTWGELRAFVEMGKHEPADAEVGIGYDENDMSPNALWVRHPESTA